MDGKDFWEDSEKKNILQQLIGQLIELNTKSVEAITKMQTGIDDGNKARDGMFGVLAADLTDLKGNFKNGFRSEIKKDLQDATGALACQMTEYNASSAGKLGEMRDTIKLNTWLLGAAVLELLGILGKMVFWP